jgi:hypothetical protein
MTIDTLAEARDWFDNVYGHNPFTGHDPSADTNGIVGPFPHFAGHFSVVRDGRVIPGAVPQGLIRVKTDLPRSAAAATWLISWEPVPNFALSQYQHYFV